MIPRFRAWDKLRKRISVVDRIYFDTEGVQLRDDGGLYWRHFREVILMQSTGILDKNSQKIFEGDVVSIDTDEFDLLFVKYESGIYWLMDDEECVEHLSDYYKYVSIVGNIYENPELLEVIDEKRK